MPAILIIEDEAKMRRLLELNLGEDGFTTFSAGDAESGLKLLRENSIDLVLTDLKLPGMNGLEFLQTIKRQNAALPVVVMTAFGSVETAVEAMKAGASDYVLKPFSLTEMRMVIHKELDVRNLREENRNLREALGKRYAHPNVVARSPKMQEVLATVERVAPTNATVLLGGESGVGKDLIARAIHEKSRRASGPFLKINSTAIPENLLESELFGFEKGAFTGAVASKPGKFELADKGTLFLDEIGDVPPVTQVKLLRVLQEREFERLGGTRTVKVDVRLIAATNKDLREALEQGTFREDLYYRLNVVPIDIAPLRERKEDIPDLANLFISRFTGESGKPVEGITPQAMQILVNYHWPGNVRELQNIVERACALAKGSVLTPDDIHLDVRPSKAANGAGGFLPDGMTLEQWEDEMVQEACAAPTETRARPRVCWAFRGTPCATGSRRSASRTKGKRKRSKTGMEIWEIPMRTRLALVSLFILVVPGVIAQTAKSEFFKTSDGIQIHYIEAGSGRAIVFIPGWTMPAWIWQKQIDEFSKKYHVVAVDPRSQGESDKPTYGHLPETRSRDYKELVNHLDLKQPVLVGWSMACGELVKYAEQFGGDNVGGFVLVDGFLPEKVSPEMFAGTLGMDEHAAAGSPETSGRFRAQHVQEAADGRLPEAGDRSVHADPGRHGRGADLRHHCRQGFFERSGQNESPGTLYLPSETQATADFLKTKLGDKLRLEKFDGDGHALFVDDPEKFNRVLEEFIQSLPK